MPVDVEVNIGSGLPAFNIVGLPGAAVQEARERVRSALHNSGFEFPLRRITVNLAPADVRKEGPIYDLPIAIGILVASEQPNRSPTASARRCCSANSRSTATCATRTACCRSSRCARRTR